MIDAAGTHRQRGSGEPPPRRGPAGPVGGNPLAPALAASSLLQALPRPLPSAQQQLAASFLGKGPPAYNRDPVPTWDPVTGRPYLPGAGTGCR